MIPAVFIMTMPSFCSSISTDLAVSLSIALIMLLSFMLPSEVSLRSASLCQGQQGKARCVLTTESSASMARSRKRNVSSLAEAEQCATQYAWCMVNNSQGAECLYRPCMVLLQLLYQVPACS